MDDLKNLIEQREALDRKIKEARSQAISDAIAKARNLIQEFDLSPHDLFPSGKRAGRKASASKVAPKYRDPATGKTWTGRGKAPLWIQGKDRSQFLI